MVGKETSQNGHALVKLSNAMVALHREYFGRGPGAAKSYVADEMVVCVLSDIYTPVERTLIRANQAEHVRRTRGLHQEALEAEYKASVEEIMGRPVAAFSASSTSTPMSRSRSSCSASAPRTSCRAGPRRQSHRR